MGWLYVPGSAGWNSDSTWPSTATAPSVSWRGKPMQPRRWSLAWKKASWLRLLSGTTLPPSTADAGVDSWISSQRATRANRSLTLASVAGRMTLGISGRTSHGSSESAGQLSFFLRTCPAIYRSDSMSSAGSFRAWAIGLRREYSARRKSALRTAASGCSRWPTTTTMDTMDSPREGIVGNHNLSLPVAARRWPTAKTPTGGAEARAGRAARGSGGEDLGAAAQQWQTPNTVDAAGRGYTYPSGDHSKPFTALPGQAQQWATLVAQDDNKTVAAHMAMKARMKGGPRHTITSLQVQTQQWATPHGLPAPRATGPASPKSSGRRLNPAFTEWLMGWPLGWTDFGPVATAWSRWFALMRSELSRLD